MPIKCFCTDCCNSILLTIVGSKVSGNVTLTDVYVMLSFDGTCAAIILNAVDSRSRGACDAIINVAFAYVISAFISNIVDTKAWPLLFILRLQFRADIESNTLAL